MSNEGLLQTESGNAVVVALDHGIAKGNIEGFERPRETLKDTLQGGPDGIIARAPFVERYYDLLSETDTDVILAPDVLTYSTLPAQDDGDDMWTGAFSPEFVREFDPAGVKVVFNFGRKDTDLHRESIEYVVKLYEELRQTDISLVVETVMWGDNVPDGYGNDKKNLGNAVRIGWELGADILKVPYTGDKAAFAEIVDRTPVPCMMLGGPATTPEATLQDVEDGMEAGARGVMIGRSIWQTSDPAEMVRAMKRIVHEKQSAAEAGFSLP
ncbi:class I fructose-bisphosphate aldolase [Haloarcula sp. GH36]|uniref:class I fructose-bisphosphate aldolase n=1 Tax=Haloarcula montana TaxID=3111776 RepID=UPI002D782944|nr:fructose-1,6-bisphosphate aldolase [Haloarcula sp. GH36]